MTTPAHPWLVADIGGTNARFGLVDAAGAVAIDVASLKTADFATVEDAARAYLADVARTRGAGVAPAAAAFAFAGPTDGESGALTNQGWTFARARIAAALRVDTMLLLNDFEANALALPKLGASERVPIGRTVDGAAGCPMAIIGPGTGLGVAAVAPDKHGGWVALPGEGGHVTVSAADDFEAELLHVVRAEFGHVSAERILSGSGLPNLYRAVQRVQGRPVLDLDAAAITTRALAGDDAGCATTLDTFCAMLGSFAGNVALTFGARGGVYVAGGIVPRFTDVFVRSRFRARFEAKGRFQSYLAAIPTAMVNVPQLALIGAAHAIETRGGAG